VAGAEGEVRPTALPDPVRAQIACAERMLVKKGTHRVENEQRRALRALSVTCSLDDVHASILPPSAV
jgi:hypothetical protein